MKLLGEQKIFCKILMINRYAILIGNSQYDDKNLSCLKFPENDVDSLYKILISKDYCNFSEVSHLKNKLSYEVLQRIEQILVKARKNDLVLIYYSGHGKQDLHGRLYLATKDTDIEILKSTSIPIESIKRFIEDSNTNKVIIILDCCYSGSIGNTFLRGGVDDQLQSLSKVRGTYIITGSTAIQVALEKESEKHGIFTKHIIEGIRDWGAADEFGKITIESLYRYVYKQMQEGYQKPMKWDLGVEGELIIACMDEPKLQQKTTWDSLASALKSKDATVRKNATEILGRSGKPALELLLQALEDDNSEIRSIASLYLGEIKDSIAVEPLILALKDNDSQVRTRAAFALGKIGDNRAVEPLIQALKENYDDIQEVSIKAEALMEFKDSDIVGLLIQTLKDNDSQVRKRITFVLGKIGDNGAVEPLIQALKDENRGVRKRAAYALGEIRDTKAIEPLIQALRDDKRVQEQAAFALIKIGKPAKELLIHALKDDNKEVRKQVAMILIKIGDGNIRVQLLKDKDPLIQKKAAIILEEEWDIDAIDPLIQLLKDEDANIRERAAFILKEIGCRDAVVPLIQFFEHEDPVVREKAAIALVGSNNPKAIENLLSKFSNRIIERI